jgi:NTP pyrophosphatase (non-canonical NTP hydrolase)
MNRNNIFNLINTDADVIRATIDGLNEIPKHDEKLKSLTVGVGQLAALIKDEGWTRAHLRRVFGFCYGWIGAMKVKNPIAEIAAERDRQNELFRTGKIQFSCSSETVDLLRKLRVLVEEVGEVAEAVDRVERRVANSRQHLISELIQVAAVAVAWLESLEVQS